MSQTFEYQTPPFAHDPGRKSALTAVGILLIIGGVLAGCMSFAALAGMMMMNARPSRAYPQQVPMSQMIAGVAIYVLVATALIWSGIGSIGAKRWVRPVMVSFAGLITIAGVGGLIGFIASVSMISNPAFYAPPPSTSMPAMPPSVLPSMITLSILAMTLFMIVIPAVLWWFYASARTRDALRAYDPMPSWTDACPVPVFAASMALLLGAASLLLGAASGFMMVFGVVLEGIAAQALSIVVCAALIAAAILCFKLKSAGWLLAVTLCGVGCVSWFVSGLTGAMATLMGRMSPQLTPAQRELMIHSPMASPVMQITMCILMGAASLSYLLWIRRYFAPGGSNNEGSSTSSITSPT